MSEERIAFKKITESDFICEIRKLNRAITKLSNERDELQQENQQLKDNWNKLKKWLENTIEQYGGFAKYRFECVYNKMQELEENNE